MRVDIRYNNNNYNLEKENTICKKKNVSKIKFYQLNIHKLLTMIDLLTSQNDG